MPVYALNGNVEIPLLLKPIFAENAVIIRAIRFVPFATADGNPKNISIGRVIREPPPAIVLIKPTIIPTTISKGYSHGMFKIKSNAV